MRSKLATETKIHELKPISPENVPEVGKPSTFTCAQCGGPIEEIHEGTVVRFRCQVGHGFTVHALLLGRLLRSEETIWGLVSNFMECSRLSNLLHHQARSEGMTRIAKKFQQVHDTCRDLADFFRDTIQRLPDATLDETTSDRKRAT